MRPDQICVRSLPPSFSPTRPLSPAIVPTSVWVCNDTDQAESLLGGDLAGYVYQRDGHPNADQLATKFAQLHQADHAVVTAAGLAALATAIISHCQAGDHVVLARQLYGGSSRLLTEELSRLGITHSLCDPTDLNEFRDALRPESKLAIVETLSNPRLEVANITALADLSHERGAALLVDNTFATPLLCRPLSLGADWVLESVSKIMNGHSDVLLGALCGKKEVWERVPSVVSTWGWASSPFDCWLAQRGLATLPLRVERASHNALAVAQYLERHPAVEHTDYPGLAQHPQHSLAARQFDNRFGWMVTFHLSGGRAAADRFVQLADQIQFCPSLGGVETSISHPASTSHRNLAESDRARLGIREGTLRLSVGIEDPDSVLAALAEGFSA